MAISYTAKGRAALVALLLPAVVLLAFTGAIIWEKLGTIRHNTALSQIAQSIQAANALIHELQSERGRSAQVLSDPDGRYLAELRRQWEATDERRAALLATIARIHLAAPAAEIGDMAVALAALPTYRGNIADRRANALASIDSYSTLIQKVQSATGSLPHLDRLAGLTAAYFDLGHLKEAFGLERAVGAVGFHAGRFDPGLLERLLVADAQRGAYTDSFLSHADETVRGYFRRVMDDSSQWEMAELSLRARAANSNEALVADADRWFEVVTQRINRVRLVENRIAEELDSLVQANLRTARTTFFWALGGGGILAVVFFGALFRSEAGARVARERLARAMEGISQGFVLWDAADRLVMCNQRFRDICRSLAPEAAAGIDACFAPGTTFEQLTRTVAVGSRMEATPDATERWVQRRLSAHRKPTGSFDSRFGDNGWIRIREYRADDGNTLGIYSDINEDKRREAALREARYSAEIANRAKTEFPANMSHEFRTPLNAIIGFSEIMKDQMLGPLANERYLSYAQDINDAGQHLLELVNDVLDIARIETGNVALAAEVIDLRAAVHSSTTLLRDRAQSKELTLTTRVAANVGALLGDSRRVKQVLVNILANAVKFTPQGGQVTVDVWREESGSVNVSVADTGIGIAEADIARVLQPFAQADASLSRPYEGSGLGLALSKNLMELHGGSLSIASTLNIGTVVFLRFPPERAVHEADMPAPHGPAGLPSGALL